MSSLILAFTVVTPIFLMMTLGYMLRVVGVFDEPFLAKLNNLCFKVFLPILIFLNIYLSDFSKDFSPKFILFAVLSVVVLFVLLVVIINRIEKDATKRPVIVQGIFRSNFVLFGMPVTISLAGNEAVSVTAILIAFIVPTFNALAVLVFELGGKRPPILPLLKSMLKNPLIIASLAAIAFSLLGIKFPAPLEKAVADIAAVATPLSLIVLGGSFYFSEINEDKRALVITVIGRLVAVPAILVPISIAMGFRGAELISLFVVYASPTAVSSFTMAQSMGANSKLAGQIVVISSLCSVASIFVWIVILKHWGFI